MALGDFLSFRISVLSQNIDRAIAALHKKGSGICLPEWRVLVTVGSNPDLCSAQIAREAQLDKVAVSRAVAGLVARGYLERKVAATDHRRSLLRLTGLGESAYVDTVRLARGLENELLDTLSDLEINALRDLNDRLSRRAMNMLDKPIRTNTGNNSS
jgi:DNA-binding MarR family transcriptional regulator